MIGAHQVILLGVGVDGNLLTALASANLKAGAILRRGVGTILITKSDGQQKITLILFGVVRVANALQIQLVPVMRPVLTGVTYILIVDAISKRVDRLAQTPRENVGAIVRVGDDRWVL